MTFVRAIARPLLAASFVTTGIDAFLHPFPRTERARPLANKLAQKTSTGANPEFVVRGTGLLAAGAGLLLATGKAPRLAGLALAASLIPASYIEYPFWSERNPERKQEERTQFVRNLGLLGGALLASVDTDGKPGLAWRGQHAAERTTAEVARMKREARLAGRIARRQARLEARDLSRSAQLKARELLPV